VDIWVEKPDLYRVSSAAATAETVDFVYGSGSHASQGYALTPLISVHGPTDSAFLVADTALTILIHAWDRP
jgi:hypothetical protein